MGWVLVGKFKDGHESVMLAPGKREIWGEIDHGKRKGERFKLGEAAWVSKIDASKRVDTGWWKDRAWTFETKEDAEAVREILNEKIATGECSEFNRPVESYVEEVK